MKQKLHLYIRDAESFVNGNFDFAFTVYADLEVVDRLGVSYPYICEFEVDIPEVKDITQIAVAGLDREIQKVRAKSEAEVQHIESRKANLLSLEHKA
ncbi:MAG: hypothetical protein GY820_21185 [Gammaproteobacteria bacterium]|nr:hypothetical protein [Gammaproteobacteria bacterium]